jgi:NitT/TauT family transport system substrate-binding protein
MNHEIPAKLSTKFALAILALVSLVVALPSGTTRAADRPLQKINVAYSSISGNVSPLWVTQDKGFFRKYGLEVQAILIESGTTTAQALVAGDISLASVAGPAAIQSNLRGADVVIIAGVINTLTFQLYTEKGITRPDQFKGKSLGVTRFGSATDFAMRYAIEKYGLDAGKDVSILQLGNQPAQLAALEAGRIQGVMLSAPTSLRAKKLGFPMLADLQMLGLEYQHTSIATSRALIKSKPDMVRDFMRAYIEGIQYAKTHRKETLDILAKYLRTDDKEVLDDTYESVIMTLIPEKPYPTQKGVQIILRELGQKDAAARAARPEQFVDLSIIKELDSSGFIDKVYKPVAVAKTAPRPEPAVAAAPSKEKPPVQVAAESKTKPVATEEKAKPVAKQIPAASEKAPAPIQKGGQQQYTVKAGDTLSKIAVQFYSAIGKWEKIFEANRDSLKNPNYIYVGMKLVIPADG